MNLQACLKDTNDKLYKQVEELKVDLKTKDEFLNIKQENNDYL